MATAAFTTPLENFMTTPEFDAHQKEQQKEGDPSFKSPISGKHHRQLSTSAKWASNKQLALEYLKRQREIIMWIEHVLDRPLPSQDLHEALKSGVVLRELMAKLYPNESQILSPISRKYSTTMAPWKERENISVFLKQCKALGMIDFSLFCTDDLYEGTNMVQVLFGVQYFANFSKGKFDHLKALAASQEQHSFSNQEVENALSRIERSSLGGLEISQLFSTTLDMFNNGEAPHPMVSSSEGKAEQESGKEGVDATAEDENPKTTEAELLKELQQDMNKSIAEETADAVAEEKSAEKTDKNSNNNESETTQPESSVVESSDVKKVTNSSLENNDPSDSFRKESSQVTTDPVEVGGSGTSELNVAKTDEVVSSRQAVKKTAKKKRSSRSLDEEILPDSVARCGCGVQMCVIQ